MELSRQDYPALLAFVQPSQATSLVADRVRVINKVNSDIADWLQERRRVEELYVQGLRKLARRSGLEGSALGIFQIPWQRIVGATESLAASHETLLTKIEEDLEKPLRDYSSKNAELKSMSNAHLSLANLSKGVESAQKKAEKARDKGPKGAEKATAALSSLEEANQHWNSRAPYVFEQLQAVDESRVNHLRDILTQFQTHELDLVERNRQIAESCLNTLLNLETIDEIKTFAAKISNGRQPPVRRQESGTQPAAAGASASPLPPPPPIQDDAASQRSGKSNRGRAPPPVPEPRQKSLGGLKRLGTVMNRRKSIVGAPSGSFSSSEKKSRGGFPFRRGDSSRDGQYVPTPSPPLAEEDGEHAATRIVTNTSSIQEEPPSSPRRDAPLTNGTVNHQQAPVAPAEAPPQPKTDAEGFTERPDTIDEITRIQREAAGLGESGLNLTIRDKPIQEDEGEAKQAMDQIANTLRLQGQTTGIRRNASTIRGRRDVRNTVFIPGGQISPVFAPGSEATLTASPASITQAPPPVAQVISEDRAMSDTTSIHSSHTLHSISGPVLHPELHEPGLNASIIETVSAWFSEGTVTKSFVVGELALAYNAGTDTTQTSSQIRLNNFAVLEKVAANPHFVTELASASTDAEERRGEYTVALGAIARSLPTVAFKYQVHLDSSNLSSYCPIIFTPAWNIQEFQASVIIPYSLNPALVTSTPLQSITLKNVVISVGLDLTPEEDEVTKQPKEVARATGALMHPNTGASFRRKQSTVVWKLPELEVRRDDGNSKLLARFTTTTSWPRKGKIEAKFEYQTPDTASRLGISMATTGEGLGGHSTTDPFADDDASASAVTSQPTTRTWTEVPTARKLVAGKYVAS